MRRHRSLNSLESVQKVFCPDDAVRLAAHSDGRHATTRESPMLTLLARLIRVGPALRSQHLQLQVTPKALALVTSFFFATTCKPKFFRAVKRERSWADSGAWMFGGGNAGEAERAVPRLAIAGSAAGAAWPSAGGTSDTDAHDGRLRGIAGRGTRPASRLGAPIVPAHLGANVHQKNLRDPIAPVNSLYSGVRVLAADRRQAVKPHVVLGADARFADSRAAWTGPLHCAA